MSDYKLGDVAALFSKPKAPTTESGKKLQSLFEQFHNQNKSAFKSEEANSQWTNKSKKAKNEESVDQRFIKRNKRKFSSLDTESQNNEPKLKKFKERDFPKKQKPFKLNSSFSDSVMKSKTNNSNENDFKSTAVSEFKNSPKAIKANSGLIKKSKRKIYDDDSFEKSHSENSKKKQLEDSDTTSLKEEIKDFLKKNSKKSKKERDNDANSQEDPQEKLQASLNFKNKPEFGKKNSKKLKKRNDDDKFEEDSPKNLESSVNFKKKSQFIKRKKSQKGSSDSVNPKELQEKLDKPKVMNEVTDFIRKPKNKNKAVNASFGSDDGKKSKPSDETSASNDNLFKSEDEDYIQNKKSKKKFHNMNNTVKKSQKKSFVKREPDFVKLLDRNVEPEEQLSRTLFIGNLPVDTRPKDLQNLFKPFGDIEYIRFKKIETNRAKIYATNAPKRLPRNYVAESAPGFVVFKEKESAVNALALCGTVFRDRHITVDFAMASGSKKLYDDKRSVFIGNLPFNVTDENIWTAFSDCGKIEGVRVVRDKETGIGKGFGYVLFSTVESKNNALSLNLKIEGRPIRINGVDSNRGTQKKSNTTTVFKTDTFKSRAKKFKKKNKNLNSRKSITKLVKKEKTKHNKKKIASILQKSMK